MIDESIEERIASFKKMTPAERLERGRELEAGLTPEERRTQERLDALLSGPSTWYTQDEFDAFGAFWRKLHDVTADQIEIAVVEPAFDRDRLFWYPETADRSSFGSKVLEDDNFVAHRSDAGFVVLPKFRIRRVFSRWTPDIIDPRGVPRLRSHLREQWEPFAVFRNASAHTWAWASPENSAIACDTEFEILRKADLWWVSEDMVDVLTATTPTVPNDVTVNNLQLPAPEGFAVFQKPVCDLTPVGRPSVPVDAMSWGLTSMDGKVVLYVSTYHRISLANGFTDEEMAELTAAGVFRPDQTEEVVWVFVGRTIWPLADDLISVPEEDLIDRSAPWSMEAGHYFIEDRRLMVAFSTLIAQESIAEIEYQSVPRAERRRSARQGVDEGSDIRVVTLRRKHRNVVEDDDDSELVEGSKRDYANRFLVSTHYRWQRVGKGRQERRLTLVRGYVKGPENKPLKIKQQVKAWVR